MCRVCSIVSSLVMSKDNSKLILQVHDFGNVSSNFYMPNYFIEFSGVVNPTKATPSCGQCVSINQYDRRGLYVAIMFSGAPNTVFEKAVTITWDDGSYSVVQLKANLT